MAKETIIVKEKEVEITKPKERTISYWELYRYSTRGEIALMCFAMFMAIIAGASLPATTLVFGDIIDVFANWQMGRLTPEQLTSDTGSKSLYFVYLAILCFVTTYAFMAIFIYTSEQACYRVRCAYLKSVMRQNVGWFDTVGAGEVATRITSDTLLVQDAIADKMPLAASALATFLAGFVISFWKSWKMTLVLLSVVPLIAISAGIMNTINGKFQARILNMYSKAANIAEESISAARTVTSFNAQKKVAGLYSDGIAGARTEGIKKNVSTGLGLGFLFFFMYLAYALAFWYGQVLLLVAEITPGTVVNVFFAVLIGAFSLGHIAPDLQAFAFGVGAGSKIFATIDRVPEIDASSSAGDKIDRKKLVGKIVLNDVEFTYPSRPDVKVLKKLSLTIEPGTTVALVGQSGSGKSTIIQLMERFYDPQAGNIKLDGKPLKSYNIASLRQMIGLVSQEPTLFEGSVADNVANGLIGSEYENASQDQKMKLIEEACVQANAHDFIMKLPEGYKTQVGDRGMLLSGGQKQRIAIARAIIKDPKILLLDEATSALDTTSERVVQDALDRVSKARTTITIAHRLSTVRDANLIVAMVQGEIVEQGTHESLIQLGGLYAKLVETQQINTSKESDTKKSEDPDKIPTSIYQPKATDADTDKPLFQDIETGDYKKMSTFSVFMAMMKLNNPELAFTIPAFFASVVVGLVYPLYALVFGSMIDTFSLTNEALTAETKKWCLAFVGIAVLFLIFTFIQNAFFGYAAEVLTERLRKLIFRAIMRQDIGFFDDEKNSTGSLTAKLSSDAQAVQSASGITLGSILQILVNLIGSIIISFIYGWKLALVAMATLPILIGTSSFRMAIFTYFVNKNKVAYEKSSQVACEAVAAIKTVQSLTREHEVFKHYASFLKKPLDDGTRSAILNTPLYAFSNSAGFLINGLVFWYGGILIAYERYTIKDFFTIFVAIVFGAQSIGRIFAFSTGIQKAKDAGEAILNLLNYTPRIDSESIEGEKIQNPSGHLQFTNVKFHYPTRPHVKVLQGLNIEVKPGQFAALVGPSGCGKSTTIGLIERFYDITGGSVTLDGIEIRKLNITDYRNVIGLVSQEPNLFDMTIKENVTFGCDHIPSQEEIETACKAANIHDFILTQPDGYNTRVGGKGGQMSGGQKQRIAIARALIRKPKILLLDEATSALDAESEKVVQEALDKASKGRTTLAIAHRLSTIQHADVIFVLKDGIVVEQGTHLELYAQRGTYYELAVQQNLSVKSS